MFEIQLLSDGLTRTTARFTAVSRHVKLVFQISKPTCPGLPYDLWFHGDSGFTLVDLPVVAPESCIVSVNFKTRPG